MQEKVIILHELDPKYAVTLFKSRARHITENELVELIKFTPKDKLPVGGDENHNGKG
jgi:hypothetical protein